MSLSRQVRRHEARKGERFAGFTPSPRTAPKYAEREPGKPQIVEVFATGGYRTLHPTRGWKAVSPARAALYGLNAVTARDIALNGLPA